jgi:mycothiol synthase
VEKEFKIREYRHADVHAVVDMLNAGGHPRAVVDGAWNVRLVRYVPVTSKKAVVEDQQGKIVGYAYVADKETSFIVETGGGVHPEYLGQGIGSILLNWAQKEAVQINQNAPAGVKCVLQANMFEGESEAIKLFEAEGFSKVREWAHYEIHLKNESIKVTLPEGMSIRSFDLEYDWELVGPVMDAAFMDHWGSYTLPKTESEGEETEEECPQDFSYSNSEGYCFIMRAGDEVAGGILCNAKLVEYKNTGRIGSVFVHPNFRRHGVGKTLMLAAFSAFHQNNVRRIILDTDSQSFTDSSKFYTSLGMTIYRREFLHEKETHAGSEIRRIEK